MTACSRTCPVRHQVEGISTLSVPGREREYGTGFKIIVELFIHAGRTYLLIINVPDEVGRRKRHIRGAIYVHRLALLVVAA